MGPAGDSYNNSPASSVFGRRHLQRQCRHPRAIAVSSRKNVPVSIGSRAPSPARTQPSKSLDVFPNPNSGRDYLIHMQVPEFTCLCPLTGQPDFAVFTIDYVPDELCVELKSLKLYAWSFRDEGAFHEAVTNRVLDDLASAPRSRASCA